MRRTLDLAALLAAVTPRLAALGTAAAPADERAVRGAVGATDYGQAATAEATPVDAAGAALDGVRATLLRRALEEWGVECRERSPLAALEAFGVISARGVEVSIAPDLPPDERALAYSRCLARLVLHDERQFTTWFHYRPGQVPGHLTADERRAMAVVDAMARALLRGRLDAAPRYLLPGWFSAESAAASGLLSDCSRALLGSLHRASSALYWRSDSYQALRATPPMVRLTTRVHALLSGAASNRAA